MIYFLTYKNQTSHYDSYEKMIDAVFNTMISMPKICRLVRLNDMTVEQKEKFISIVRKQFPIAADKVVYGEAVPN